MRNELELIEKIERYLKDQLSAVEKTVFEEEINKDPKLQEEVALQREVLNGIERTFLRQKVQQAGIRFRQGRGFMKWGIIGFCVIVVIVAALYYNKKVNSLPRTYKGGELPEYNESGNRNWADADRNLPAQIFILDVSNDTVIETRGGIVLSISANGFLDKDGQTVKGKVELVVREALNPRSIINAGLSSRSGNELLESGGMFFVDARKDGESLQINPSNGLYAEVQTDTIKPGMQLFSGKRMPDGTIDWINPRPLEHNLVPVDIHLLDFYPPQYLDSITRWGYNAGNKEFTDSLYFSFASFSQTIQSHLENKEYYRDSAINPVNQLDLIDSGLCGINPAKIKAIWSKHFENTLLSTREFEQRISWIHRSANNHILDLYVNNLDKNLFSIDSMAAMQLSGELRARFLSFASRQDGRIKNGIKQLNKLREYYQRKERAFTQAISKTQNDFWNKEAALDRLADTKKQVHQQDSAKRVNQNFIEEFRLNLKEAYKQLEYDTTINLRSWKRNTYAVQVTNTGWCNVDRFVNESVLNRTTLDFTDTQNGGKASIKDLPASFQVEQPNEYDRLYLYLLPDKLSSFMRLSGSDGKYLEKLNELMKYKLVCIGYRGEQAFFYSRNDILPKDYSRIVLTKIGKNELDQALNDDGSRVQASDLQQETIFFRFELKDQKRQKRNHALLELRERVLHFIFPCYVVS